MNIHMYRYKTRQRAYYSCEKNNSLLLLLPNNNRCIYYFYIIENDNEKEFTMAHAYCIASYRIEIAL